MKKIYVLTICILCLVQLCGCSNSNIRNNSSSQSSGKAHVTTTSPTTIEAEGTTTPITSEKPANTVPFKTVTTQISLETLKGSKISESTALELCKETYIKYINKDTNTNSAAKFLLILPQNLIILIIT